MGHYDPDWGERVIDIFQGTQKFKKAVRSKANAPTATTTAAGLINSRPYGGGVSLLNGFYSWLALWSK
jgi:hypothetical protein